MHGSPKVQDIAVHGAVGVKTVEDAFAEVDGEGVLAVGGLGMQRARATPLVAVHLIGTGNADIVAL